MGAKSYVDIMTEYRELNSQMAILIDRMDVLMDKISKAQSSEELKVYRDELAEINGAKTSIDERLEVLGKLVDEFVDQR